jgi:hypothetical protein
MLNGGGAAAGVMNVVDGPLRHSTVRSTNWSCSTISGTRLRQRYRAAAAGGAWSRADDRSRLGRRLLPIENRNPRLPGRLRSKLSIGQTERRRDVIWRDCALQDKGMTSLSFRIGGGGAGIAQFDAKLAAHILGLTRALRHAAGLLPASLRNSLVKCAWSARPQSAAIWLRDESVESNIPCARSMRRRMM